MELALQEALAKISLPQSEHTSELTKFESNVPTSSRFKKLNKIHLLQNNIIKENMHNARSPISAISGYLDLIEQTLGEKPDVDQIHYYREKIERGILEVNTIIDQLQNIYEEVSLIDNKEEEDNIDVELNWLISEVSQQIDANGARVSLIQKDAPIYACTDYYVTKLILFKLLTFALKCCYRTDRVELETSKQLGYACLSLTFPTNKNKRQEIETVLFAEDEPDLEALSTQGEGLALSAKLLQDVGGKISFLSTNEYRGMLRVRLPLSQ